MLGLADQCLELLSPHICKGCGAVGSTFCSRCILYTTKHNYPICVSCDKPCKSNNLCAACREKNKLFDQVVCVGERSGALAHLIGDYKYNSEVASCRPIAKLVYIRLRQAGIIAPHKLLDDEVEAAIKTTALSAMANDNGVPANLARANSDAQIVAIPTIAKHIRQRGFDHMLLVARELSKLSGLPVNTKLLTRADNVSQHTLSAVDRRKLIKRSLVLRRKIAVVPSTVILIDDIWTTGSTLSTAAALLRQIGVQKIIAVAILKQPHNY